MTFLRTGASGISVLEYLFWTGMSVLNWYFWTEFLNCHLKFHVQKTPPYLSKAFSRFFKIFSHQLNQCSFLPSIEPNAQGRRHQLNARDHQLRVQRQIIIFKKVYSNNHVYIYSSTYISLYHVLVKRQFNVTRIKGSRKKKSLLLCLFPRRTAETRYFAERAVHRTMLDESHDELNFYFRESLDPP